MRIPLGASDESRSVLQVPDIPVLNRYFERDPTNQQDQVALPARPGLRKWKDLSANPVRKVYSQPGSFDDALFVVHGTMLTRIDQDETETDIGTIAGTGYVSMAATAYPYNLFIANGLGLQLYDGSTLSTVTVPDGDGIVSVGFIAGSIICVVAQDEDKNGRFYWIEPGETTIDPLNFATAERSPDPVWSVEVVGDQFWFPGPSTNEVWYPSGDALAPFLRQQGRLFDKGTWEGTILRLEDSVFAVGVDGTVYEITDQPRVISTPGIAERFRRAINARRAA